jgi:hypothetical protein
MGIGMNRRRRKKLAAGISANLSRSRKMDRLIVEESRRALAGASQTTAGHNLELADLASRD